jgi:hypothetical protein
MLFKRGLTNGLHRAVLEKTVPHPTTLRGWMDAAHQQYELWAEIKASLSGNFGQPQPSPTKSNQWKGVLTKKNQWAPVKRDDKMEVDMAQVNALTTEEKTQLQKEGRCFHCKRMGHISRNCQQKKNNDAPNASRRNQGTTTWVTETGPIKVERAGRDERIVADIKGMTVEERSELLDKLVLEGF